MKRSVLGLILLLSPAAATAGEPLSRSQFEAVRAVVQPPAEEGNWLKIPWLISLWEAREKAAAEGKPILLWEMDGHPLGCT